MEKYLKTAKEMHCSGAITAIELRRRLLAMKFVMIGWIDADTGESTFDVSLDDCITLNPNDKLIVIGACARSRNCEGACDGTVK